MIDVEGERFGIGVEGIVEGAVWLHAPALEAVARHLAVHVAVGVRVFGDSCRDGISHEKRPALHIFALSTCSLYDGWGQGEGERHYVAILPVAFQSRERPSPESSIDGASIYVDLILFAPSWYAEDEGEVRLLWQGEAEGDVAAEGIIRLFCNVTLSLAYLEVYLAGSVHCCDDGFVLASHPESGGEVGHHAMHVTGTALGLVGGSVGHPCRAALELVVVGVACADDLVDGREVLYCIEVRGDGTRGGVEDGALYAVGPFSLTCCGEEIAERPGVVGDVASLVSHFDVVPLRVLCTGGHTVGQEMVAFQLPFCIHRDVEIRLLARVSVEQEGDLEHLAIGDAMQMDELIAAGIGLVELEAACVVSCLGFGKQSFCTSLAIKPEQAFEVEDVATAFSEVVVGHRVVVPAHLVLERCRYSACIGIGFYGSPEDGLRPETADDRGAQPAVGLWMRESVFDACLALRDELFIVEQVAQS